jgi:hypothetical protein
MEASIKINSEMVSDSLRSKPEFPLEEEKEG